MKKQNIFRLLLATILVLGFLVRLYRFDGPVADWHSWRQSDTAAVTRNFALHGFDLLHPSMDNISNVQSGLDNPHGYFFVEFPLYNAVSAGLFKLFGMLTVEEWGRLVTITSSLLISVFLYLLVSKYGNKQMGIFAAFFSAFIPFNIYYGRTLLADTSMCMAVLGGIYFFDRWLDAKSKKYLYYVLTIVFTTAALLLKPHALFFLLPLVYLAFKKFGFKTFLQWQLWVFLIVTITPLALWRMWMTHFPEGIPDNAWLFNGDGIRFRPAFFRWIVYERLTVLISGYIGIVFGFVGLYTLRKNKNWLFFASFFAGSILYVSTLATGNVRHDYYQILIMPSVAILFAIGAYFLYNWNLKKFPAGKILVALLLIAELFFSWMRVRDYFNINNRAIVIAGKAVDTLTPKDALVIANYNGDSSFLYQTKRKGWASLQKPFPEMIKLGATYLVLANPTDSDRGLKKEFKVVAETKEYLLFDLTKKP